MCKKSTRTKEKTFARAAHLRKVVLPNRPTNRHHKQRIEHAVEPQEAPQMVRKQKPIQSVVGLERGEPDLVAVRVAAADVHHTHSTHRLARAAAHSTAGTHTYTQTQTQAHTRTYRRRHAEQHQSSARRRRTHLDVASNEHEVHRDEKKNSDREDGTEVESPQLQPRNGQQHAGEVTAARQRITSHQHALLARTFRSITLASSIIMIARATFLRSATTIAMTTHAAHVTT
jgi:hypothetical protein